MTVRPLQDQLGDIAVFGATLVVMGFFAGMMRGMAAGAFDKETGKPALMPSTKRGGLLVRYTGGPQRFAFPMGLEGEIRNYAAHDWVIQDTPRNRRLIKEAKRWTVAQHQPAHLQPQTLSYYTISFQGDTAFNVGEIVSAQTFQAENERVTKLGLRPARGWITSKGELMSWRNGWRPPEELAEYQAATSIPGGDLTRIADKYGWWAANLAQSVCPHNDVACVEREARRLAEARKARLK